jgi:hypothetical protein
MRIKHALRVMVSRCTLSSRRHPLLCTMQSTYLVMDTSRREGIISRCAPSINFFYHFIS